MESRSSKRNIVYTGCCRGGMVSLPTHREFPSPLRELIRFDGGSRSNRFMRLIRQYNSLFSFTSLGVEVDRSINTGDGPYVFRINGVVHHKIGSLAPPPGRRPEYAQLYIFDTQNEVRNRLNILDSESGEQPDPHIVSDLVNMLNQINPLVQQFRMARDRMFSPSAPEVCIRLAGKVDNHGDRYSLPSVPELAALLIGGDSPEVSSFDVIVEANNSVLKHISPIHPSLMALQYPLLFPYRDIGYHPGIKFRNVGQRAGARDEVSMLEYYAYYMHYRKGEPNPVLCSGRLSRQYQVDSYSSVEANRLSFYFFNQDLLRCDTYQGISDAVGHGASTGKDVGVKRMLPSSHIGGKRYMQQNYQDCMAICTVYGPPQKFVTFTCNSKWPEIADAIRFENGQGCADRADIVVRVFHMKLEELLDDIKEGNVFGSVRAVAYTNEFQKRGLPHSHILAWQSDVEREHSISDVDKYISAELPDPNVDPLGFSLVQEFMIHGPCGPANPKSPCMKDGKCSKRYPKEFRAETAFDPVGYPLYRRRQDGIVALKGSVQVDNRWVVPHNLLLLKKYQAHINVEACNQTHLVKYLFKYVNKGFDCVRMRLKKGQCSMDASQCAAGQADQQDDAQEGIDEIAEYMKSRYLSCCEATWRLFGFEIHGKFPAVERLMVHMPGFNFVNVNEHEQLQPVVDDPDSQKSMLTEWFVANQASSAGHDLTYCQFPSRYTWDADSKTWKLRRRGFKLGRLKYVHPSTGENFYLRMLLMIVRGAKSYEEVRMYDGVLYSTFREACQARGLIGDDSEWACLFDEAVVWATSHQLRNLFMTVLVYCNVGNARALFDKYWKYMADDVAYRIRQTVNNSSLPISDSALQCGLMRELTHMFSNNGLSIAAYNLPTQDMPPDDVTANRLILEEMNYDRSVLLHESDVLASMLNSDQKIIYNTVIEAISDHRSFLYFISGHGGTGKTFLWNAILATLRSDHHIVLAVASCGVAALLLPGGRTAHSRFKIPLDVQQNSMCAIARGTMLADLICRTSLVIWDEAPMTHKHCFEALDHSFRDILSVHDPGCANLPFGGKPILFGGDFRQMLPVVEGAGRSEIIQSSLLGSYLWTDVTVLRLTVNMRLCSPSLSLTDRLDLDSFAKWVLDIGEGRISMSSRTTGGDRSWISIPDEFIMPSCGSKIVTITDAIYTDFQRFYSDVSYLAERCIVCPVNSVVDEINDFMVDKVPGGLREYLSFDAIASNSKQPSDFTALYPPEFLNSITINNFPAHRLCLKIGVPVVLLRNMNQSIGLCNGTRILIERLGDRVLEGRIMTGNHIGDMVCIPRIVLNGKSHRWPFTLQRRQFPVRVSYAMTINKCQGQTLKHVGVYLRDPVFAHGQLYVAVSRVSSRNGLKMLIEDDSGNSTATTKNIVYEEVLEYV